VRVALFGALVAAGALASTGCMSEYHPEYHPQTVTSYKQVVSYPTTIFAVGGAPPVVADAPETAPSAQGDPSHVLVLQSTHLDRPSEVIGVVDAHVPMGNHDAALDVLRRHAAAMGADAVVGVEFHHGEGEGQPTHLSGLAVRFLQAVPYPIDH
jgi:hypothetical protein